MAGSYRVINYDTRPAKHAERMMLVDMLRRVERIAALKTYRYVGLGSAFFTDFRLVHAALGISDLVSIEAEIQDQQRIEFNKPFACVELRFGHSSIVLPQLDWAGHNIVWLDYDGPLDLSVIADVELLSTVLRPGSVLIVSVNAHPGDLSERAARARQRLADELPLDVTDNSLGGWGTAAVSYGVLRDVVGRAIKTRNLGVAVGHVVSFDQLFHFRYQDGSRMLTFGGVFTSPAIQGHVAACQFSDFDYYRFDSTPYRIEAPNLTFSEMSFLDKLLPGQPVAGAGFLPASEVRKYSSLYRYLPDYRNVGRY